MKITKKYAIEFSKKQFFSLLKAVYLGDWLANATRIDNTQEEYQTLVDYLFSKAKSFGYGKYVDHDTTFDNHFYPTMDFDDLMQPNIEEYDNETFWEEFVHRMGERDFYNKYSEKEIKKMDQKERFLKLYECIDPYYDEVAKYGIDRVAVHDE